MSIKYRVWSNFTVKLKNGDIKKLRIQDAPKDCIEDVSHLFAQHFVPGETFHKLAEISKNKEAVEECRQFILEMMQDKNSSVVICCGDDDPDSDRVDNLVAGGVMTLMRRDDPEEDFDVKTKTKEMDKMLKMMFTVFEMYDAMKELELESTYDDRGVVVHANFRGLGIAQRMFNIRRMICKEEGIPCTGAWMTGIGSQKAAERDNWETVFEISYEEIGSLFDVTFQNVPPTCKFMIARVL